VTSTHNPFFANNMTTEQIQIEDQSEMLLNRVRKNIKKVSAELKNESITCYRLYDRDIPEIPVAIDFYEGKLHVSLYDSTHTKDTADTEKWLRQIASPLSEYLAIKNSDVFFKRRVRGKGGSQYGRMNRSNQTFEVSEGGSRFIVNLSDYLDTGLFLDHRNTRKMVGYEADGRHFLNLFAYTGAFSVYAARGGAISTTTVDLSNTYLDWAEENMSINGFKGSKHTFVKEDILNALEERRVERKYDLVIVDPPTISKSKSMKRSFDIQKDYTLLLNRVLEICNRGALVYFSTNFRKFKFNRDRITCQTVEEITHKTIPLDFRNKKIHRCFRLKK